MFSDVMNREGCSSVVTTNFFPSKEPVRTTVEMCQLQNSTCILHASLICSVILEVAWSDWIICHPMSLSYSDAPDVPRRCVCDGCVIVLYFIGPDVHCRSIPQLWSSPTRWLGPWLGRSVSKRSGPQHSAQCSGNTSLTALRIMFLSSFFVCSVLKN
jgi:hypothetical protein